MRLCLLTANHSPLCHQGYFHEVPCVTYRTMIPFLSLAFNAFIIYPQSLFLRSWPIPSGRENNTSMAPEATAFPIVPQLHFFACNIFSICICSPLISLCLSKSYSSHEDPDQLSTSSTELSLSTYLELVSFSLFP